MVNSCCVQLSLGRCQTYTITINMAPFGKMKKNLNQNLKVWYIELLGPRRQARIFLLRKLVIYSLKNLYLFLLKNKFQFQGWIACFIHWNGTHLFKGITANLGQHEFILYLAVSEREENKPPSSLPGMNKNPTTQAPWEYLYFLQFEDFPI